MKSLRNGMRWASRKGVSDLIGTLIVLTITVILFTGLITFVVNLPGPTEEERASFKTTFELQAGNHAKLSLIHIGGEPLRTSDIRIFVYVNDTAVLQSSPTTQITTEKWTIGQKWEGTVGGVTLDSKVFVSVIDYVKNVVVYSEYLLGSNMNSPPVILRIGTFPDPVLIKTDFKVFAIVWDPDNNLNRDSVYVNLSDVHPNFANGTYKLNYVGGNRFERSFGKMPDMILPNGQGVIKNVTVNATDSQGLPNIEGTGNGTITIGKPSQLPENVDLVIRQDANYLPFDIRFSKVAPVQGDFIMIYIRVTNVGGMATNVSVKVQDNGVFIGNATDRFGSTSQRINGNFDTKEFQLLWQVRSAGMHRISANASVVGNYIWEKDKNPANNTASADLGAMPRILVVDDDNYPSDGTYRDTAGYLCAALKACGFPFDLHVVRQAQDGPKYSTGDPKLEDYGVVLWTTGYEVANTLRPSDIASLTSYLSSDNRGLWLLGQDILNDLATNVSGGPQFILNQLHITGVDYNKGLSAIINGTASHFLTSTMNMTSAIRPGTSDNADYITLDAAPGTKSMLETYGDGKCVAMTYNNSDSSKRMCFTPFELSRIRSSDDITILTFKVVLWLGNLTRSFGVDLAVTSQEIDNTNPYYFESVKVSFTIRNNSDINLTSVHYSIFLDYGTPESVALYDSIGKKMCDMVPIPRTLEKGGFPNASYSAEVGWVADRLGLHTITVFVDPSNELDEINEENNIASPPFAVTRIFVRYNVLVVDDDDSENNGGTEFNSTENITHALDFLNYKYDFQISSPEINTTYMQQYNLVIWSSGRAADALAPDELQNITDYLQNQSGNVWLIGHGIIDSLAPSGVLSSEGAEVFKLTSVVRDCALPSTLYGAPDSFAHGANYKMNSTGISDVDAMSFDTSEGAFCILADSTYSSFMMAYKNESDYPYTSVITSFDPALLMNDDDMHELIYLVLHYFKMPDERIELRVTGIDLFYATQSTNPTPLYQMKPVLGNSYMIQATIWNVGGNRGDAVIRFVDGINVINSGVVSVREDGSTVIEVIWTPLFAGSRTITAIIDPVDNIPVSYDPMDATGEILKANNRASVNLEVYYFYDDMENGGANWRHDTTLVNINGESPIEFVDEIGLVHTNVNSQWADMHGFDEVTMAYNSFNSSFYMYEGWGGGPVDVYLYIDRSQSMGSGDPGTPLYDAKQAAKNMISNLSDASTVSISMFHGAGSYTWLLQQQVLDAAGRTTVNTTIDGIREQSITQLWDPIGVSLAKALSDSHGDNKAAIVILSDGCDRQGSDAGAITTNNADINGLEGGSLEWDPWHNYGTGWSWGTHYGKYGGDASSTGFWAEVQPRTKGGGTRNGLLNAPIPIFTIGLNLEHHYPVYLPETATFPGDRVWDPINAVYKHSDNTQEYQESGTVEYNLYRVSLTSNGKYFYARDSADLSSIFDTIGRIISGGAQARGARASPDGPAPVHTNGARAAATIVLDNPANGIDAYIDQAAAGTNFGGSTVLRVQGTKNNLQKTTLIKFNLTTAGIPMGSTITSALLRLYKTGVDTNARTVYVNRLTSNWEESLVTWAAPPSIYTVSSTDSLSVSSNAQWYSWDVTSDLQLFMSGTTNYGWALRDTGAQSRLFEFVSKESANANKPRLEITYTPPAIPTPAVTDTFPVNHSIDCNVMTPIVINYSMAMDPAVTPTITFTPAASFTPEWTDSDTLTLTPTVPLGYSTKYTVNVSNGVSTTGQTQVGVYSFDFTTVASPTPPSVIFVQPTDGEMGVSVTSQIIIVFSDPMNDVTKNAVILEPFVICTYSWMDTRTLILQPMPSLQGFTTYIVTVRAALTLSTSGGAMEEDYVFGFETGSSSAKVPGDRWLETGTFNLSGYESARLSFFQRYNLRIGANGGVIQVGNTSAAYPTTWKWQYVYPLVPYTGNVKFNITPSRIYDSYNTPMTWAYNGISSMGTFAWEFVEVDLTPFISRPNCDKLRVRFLFLNVAGGAGGGWAIDDVQVKAVRAPSTATVNSMDQWELSTNKAHSGNYAWWCHNTSTGASSDAFRAGIDTSLYTKPIDLTNALNATLNAYMAFNFNYLSGRPPDSLRVEISPDGGKSWRALTLGARACWNISGTDPDIYDGKLDNKSYSGISETGIGWVPAGTLSRLSCDLSGWAGQVVILRFRIVTATDHLNYQPGYVWGTNTPYFGFYLDDVSVTGTSAG